ncbi:enhancer of mRNA decapping 4 [Mactra antiquata]
MDEVKSPTSSMESTGDTSRLLKELMDLQKSTASSMASIDRSVNVQESHEIMQTLSGMVQNSGDATDPTLTEFMKTMYDGSSARQLITLQGTDTANSFSVFGQEVDIVASKQINKSQSLSGSTGSNKVKITPVVNYDWEQKRYIGNLVAVHRANIYVAYVLKGKTGGVVRITNRKTAERHLLKDFCGRVIDLAFAHTDDVLLAVVDEIGNLCVYELVQTDDRKIASTLLLHIQRPESTVVSEYHRVIWCPYIPDDSDDSNVTDSSTQTDNASRVLVLTNDEKAEIWSVDLVVKEYGSGPLLPSNVDVGLIQINSHTKPIMDAAFSPDGTALATASIDGEVKFFQVYMNEKTSPRCLHVWKPHGGKPMSCLFFLDDHKNCSPDAQFWKFAITGANYNQEIKLWSCESWKCLQTIRFLCPPNMPSNFSVEPCMKASLDLSAKFFVLSDIKRNVLYVLQIYQDSLQNTAHVSSVSEFTLAQPCLSFAILSAGTRRLKKSKGDDSHLDEITTGEIVKEDGDDDDRQNEDNVTLSVQIKLYTVHPKALQELLIRYTPECSVPHPPAALSVSSVSQSDGILVDGLSDVSMPTDSVDEHNKNDSYIGNTPMDLAHSGTQPVLLTPDAFTSSPRKSYPDDSIHDNVRGSMSSTSSFTQVSAMNDDFLSPRSSTASTITQTPTTPKTEPQSPATSKPAQVTSNNIPLSTIESTEENESTTSSKREPEVREVTPTPEQTQQVDDFFQQKTTERRDLQMVSLDSTESMGEYSRPVEDIVHGKSQSSYDEMDEEVAEVMGDNNDDDDDDNTYNNNQQQPGDTQPFEEQQGGDQVVDSTESSIRAWPKPPDVNGAGDSIEKLQESTENNDNGDDDDDDGDDDDDDNDDDDVVVEEEENVCNDDDDDDVKRDDDGDNDDDDDEVIEEEIEEEEQDEEQDPSVESLENKREPMVAPVAGSSYNVSPRDKRPVEVREIHRETVREVFDKQELQKLHSSMSTILQAIQTQQQQLDILKCNMSQQQESYLELQRRQLEQEQLRQVSEGAQPSIEEHLGKLENIVTSRVERLFNQHSQRENILLY